MERQVREVSGAGRCAVRAPAAAAIPRHATARRSGGEVITSGGEVITRPVAERGGGRARGGVPGWRATGAPREPEDAVLGFDCALI